MKRRDNVYWQFALYGTIGVLNTFVHWAVFLGVINSICSSYTIANAAGFIISASLSYLLNSTYTFKNPGKVSIYWIYNLLILLIAAGVGFVGEINELHPFIVLTSFSFSSLVVGFIFNKRYVFVR